MLMHTSLAGPDIYLRSTIAAFYIAKKYQSTAPCTRKARDVIGAHAMYDEKDTARRKRLRGTERFWQNVAIFDGCLSKASRQLTLTYASGAASRIPAIFI
jgi:hypothetical protein